MIERSRFKVGEYRFFFYSYILNKLNISEILIQNRRRAATARRMAAARFLSARRIKQGTLLTSLVKSLCLMSWLSLIVEGSQFLLVVFTPEAAMCFAPRVT